MDETQSEQEPSTTNTERSFIGSDNFKYEPQDAAKKSGKAILLIIGLLVILGVGGFFLNQKLKILPGSGQTPQSISSETPASIPTPSPQPVLDRSEWSFEILNGSGETGLARRMADQIRDLGYEIVRVGNADRSDYSETQITVREGLAEKVDLVIADLGNTIKIASAAGELIEGTASARIIIGKDSAQ